MKFTKILSDSGKCWWLLRNEDVVGLKSDSNMWKVRKVIGNILGNILGNFFVNLKQTTEGQEAMNITCSHKDS